MNGTRPISHSGLASLIILTLVAVGCQEPVAPEPSPALDVQLAVVPAPHRPMDMVGTVAVVAEVLPAPAECLFAFRTRIRLTATHMGKVVGDGQTCVESLTPDLTPPFTPPGPPPYGTAPFVASWVLTAANGDELWLEGFESVAVLGLESGSLRARGQLRIVGGSGRFSEATGELEASSVNYFGQPADDFQATGWIGY